MHSVNTWDFAFPIWKGLTESYFLALHRRISFRDVLNVSELAYEMKNRRRTYGTVRPSFSDAHRRDTGHD